MGDMASGGNSLHQYSHLKNQPNTGMKSRLLEAVNQYHTINDDCFLSAFAMDLLRVVDLKIAAAIKSKRTILVVHHGNVVKDVWIHVPGRPHH